MVETWAKAFQALAGNGKWDPRDPENHSKSILLALKGNSSWPFYQDVGCGRVC